MKLMEWRFPKYPQIWPRDWSCYDNPFKVKCFMTLRFAQILQQRFVAIRA